MKTHLYHAFLLAGVIAFGATPGRGQALKVNVPFPFQTTNAEMPAGEYSVSRIQSGTPVIVLNNWDTHKTDMILAAPKTGEASDTRPRMVFQCSGNHCVLAEVWGITSGGGVQLSQPRGKSRDHERLAVVYFPSQQAGK